MKHFNLSISFFFIALFIISGNFNTSNAQVKAINVRKLINNNDWNFVENIGQLADAQGQLHSDIKYYSHNGGPDIYCRPGMISFVFSKLINNADGTDADLFQAPKANENKLDLRRHWEDEITNKKISTVTSRADMVLLNANPAAQIIGQDKQAYYENYYTSYTPESGVNKALTYKTIVYKNVYPNIDMLIHAKTSGMEYEFVIYPGGNVSDIQIQWNGLQNMEMMQNGGLHYVSNMIDMQDSKPVSFIPGGTQVPSSFEKNENEISFNVAEYDHSQKLTIDPTIDWGTYLGGGARDYCQAVWTDALGNVMICGPCTGTNSIGTSGAFQSTYSGSAQSDAFLAKFSAVGALLWCTYYGGGVGYGGSSTPYNDGWGLSTDNFDNIYMGGATSATVGIATSGSYQSFYAGVGTGSYGGYIVKFRPNGARVWATYYGSTVNDQVLFVATDLSANVFITAWANSSSGLASSGAYQTSYGGGQDVGLAKYDSTGKQLWSTYYGGSGYEAGNVVATDLNGNVLVCGETGSSSGISSPGAYQTKYGGGDDAFVASFSPSGNLNWSTYLGSSAFDEAWGVVADQFGYVYVNGQTASKTSITYNIPYQPSLAGTTNSFLSKFSSTGTMIWSTYYGGNGSDIGNNLCTDPTGSIFVTGQTTSKSGIATPGGYLTSLPGGTNAFFSKFSPAGNLMYGTYYGGSGPDAGYDVHSDAFGNTYMAGSTESTSGIATSGGYNSGYVAGSQDEFVNGLFFHTYLNDAGIIFTPPGYCSGPQTIKVTLENFGSNSLTSATLGWSLNGKAQTPISWTGSLATDSVVTVSLGTYTFSAGTDTIKAWTSKPNGILDSMPQNDTLKSKVLFVAYPTVNAGGNKKLCAGSSTFVGPNSGSGVTYSWTSKPSGFVSNSMQPKVTPSVTTTYYLTETTTIGGCAASDSATVTVGQIPTPNAGNASTICYGGSAAIGQSPIKGHSYAWSSVPIGFSSSISNPTASPTTTSTFYMTEIDTVANCVAYSSVVITVNPEAKANAGGNQSICPKASATIGTSAASGHSYKWTSNPAGFTSTVSNPRVSPDTITTYYLSDIINATGCTAGDSAIVSFNPLPVANSGGNQTICSGSNVQLGNTAVNGDTYSWTSKPTGFTSTSSNPTVNPTVTTDYYITEIITATGCSKTDTAIVTTNPLPTPNTGGNQVICIGGSIQLGSGSNPGHSYLWTSKPAGFKSTSAFPTVSPTVTTTYYLTEIITATGCYKKDSATVKVNSETANAGTSRAICIGQADTLGIPAVNVTTYTWTSNPVGFSDATANPVVKPTVSTTYYLKETSNITSCSGIDSVMITVNPLPRADAGQNQTICAGISTSIGDTSTALDSFSWTSSPTGFTSDVSNPPVSPTATTVYHLTETNPNTGCSKTNLVAVVVNPLPDAEWFVTYSGNTAYIHADDSSLSRHNYLWNLGDGDTASGYLAKHLYLKDKSYYIKLTITGADGCTNSLDSSAKILYSGIEENHATDFDLNVFPNPFQNSASIEYNLNTSGKIKIVLLDVTGRQIGVVANENQVPGSYHFDLSAEKYHLSPGMYLLQFMNQSPVNSLQSTVKIVRY